MLDVEAAGLGIAEGRQERAMRHASPYGCEVPTSKSGANEQGVPPLTLGHGGQGQVLGREPVDALCLGRLAADHVVGSHVGALVAQHAGQHFVGGHRFGRLVVGRLWVVVVVGVHIEWVDSRPRVANT